MASRQPLRDPGICSSDLQQAQRSRQLSATLDFQGATLCKNCPSNWHWIFTFWTLTFLILDIYTVNNWTLGKIGISFQLPPPGSSTKPALASSLHHQTAAPHQPASSKASSQPAVNSTPTSWQPGLLFRYHVIIFFYCILVWAICTGIKDRSYYIVILFYYIATL